MALVDQLFIGGVWVDSDVQGENTTGTPVVSAVLSNTGEEISDVYTLTVSNRSGGTGDITVATGSPNNPFDGNSKVGVAFDDTTEYTDIVPGVTIVFDNAAANGNTAEITVGSPYGTFDASGVGAGVPTAGVQHQVFNDGASSVNGCQAKLLTQAIQVFIINRVFNHVVPFAENAVEKTAGGGSDRVMPYVATISGVSGTGPSKVATLSIDGVAFPAASLLDLTTGSLVSGTGIKAVSPPYPYRVVDGDLEGLEFAIHEDVVNGDEANVMIFSSRYVQIAPDVAGVAGTWGTTPVDLTETGESTGVITASGVAHYWVRFLVPASANNESNPHPANVALSASISSSAGWED